MLNSISCFMPYIQNQNLLVWSNSLNRQSTFDHVRKCLHFCKGFPLCFLRPLNMLFILWMHFVSFGKWMSRPFRKCVKNSTNVKSDRKKFDASLSTIRYICTKTFPPKQIMFDFLISCLLIRLA